MKKSILKLGKPLNKAAQQEINGGFFCTDIVYICYGSPFPDLDCGTCEEYNALSVNCRNMTIHDCN